ncbi:MAG: hypothetical protein EA398_11575 [Deltaproteobacteria bacterium]|nr:MAG: hypothetical protein EA398_11575 [Deltaproteobacteria bacterium]
MNQPAHDASEVEPSASSSPMEALLRNVEFSFTEQLRADPEARPDGRDHRPRQVRSGHYVPVAPTPIASPEYVSHSPGLFRELGLPDELARDEAFRRIFSGDLSRAPAPFRSVGWATGYALSIYGTEYTQQCPFRTGNGYGDGRALSIAEVVADGQRWELQLKGGGPTPYCRGADGRAVLRSSVREFLAQEYMHALGVPTSRSLSLFASTTETVMRPWYSAGSRSFEPDVMKAHRVAISTRVAPSFLRVGQLELFGRRVRSDAHPHAREELRLIVSHAIAREYPHDIDRERPFGEQVVALARRFRARVTALVADWIRVGYCQGNFNSDNCAVGGFTLDYGPFGFCEAFDPWFQPWTGGGKHFSFFNQPAAAEANFHMLCRTLQLLVEDDPALASALEDVRQGFAAEMQFRLERMWAGKLGLERFDGELCSELFALMQQSRVDYTPFFRALCDLPGEVAALERTFHEDPSDETRARWQTWLERWRDRIGAGGARDLDAVSAGLKRINPRYAWREWMVVPAYERAEQGDYARVRELQELFGNPYVDQPGDLAAEADRMRPPHVEGLGGVSHFSCSS